MWPECGGGSSGGGSPSGAFDVNNLLNTVLNDITQIVKPGTPALRPLYTSSSTAASNLTSSPMLLLAGLAAVVLLVMRKR